MEQFAIGPNFKSAAARRNERERFDAFAEFKNFGRQTDGLRRVVSNHAIFDRDFGLHSELLSEVKLSVAQKRVKSCSGACSQAPNSNKQALGTSASSTGRILSIASRRWCFAARFSPGAPPGNRIRE